MYSVFSIQYSVFSSSIQYSVSIDAVRYDIYQPVLRCKPPQLFERYYSLLLYVHLSPLTLKCDLQTLAERIVVIGQMVWQPTVCTPSFVDEPSDRQ